MSGSVWGRRRARALGLLREAPHAEELLVFYAELSEVQERVAEQLPVDAWLRLARSVEDARVRLRPDLDPGLLRPHFRAFLRHLGDAGTDVIRSRTQALLRNEADARDALRAGAGGFHARAFRQAVMTTLAAGLPQEAPGQPAGDGTQPERCRVCASPPVVGILRDVPDALGARSLGCSLCAAEWRVNRLACAHCGETSADRLSVHAAESVPHVRVDECRSCGRYLKTVDLRQRGDAVPVVDEIAAVELDLWARDRGLEKVQPNMLDL